MLDISNTTDEDMVLQPRISRMLEDGKTTVVDATTTGEDDQNWDDSDLDMED